MRFNLRLAQVLLTIGWPGLARTRLRLALSAAMRQRTIAGQARTGHILRALKALSRNPSSAPDMTARAASYKAHYDSLPTKAL